MKISAETLNIMKSFSSINPSIYVAPGNTIRSISPSKTIMSSATVDDTFETEFAIYDLNRFLSVISLFESPEFEFEDTSVLIKTKGSSTRYFFADKNMVMVPPEKEINLPDILVSFTLTADLYKASVQAANVLQVPNWRVRGDGSDIAIEVSDAKNAASDNFRVLVGETDKEFDVVFKVDNLKLMMNTYNVEVSSKGISKFATQDEKLTYFVATESR